MIVHCTSKGGRPTEFDMFDKKDFATICHLIKNHIKGTTWRILRYDISNPKKTQKSRRSYAPGFTTPLDDDCSAREISVNIDKTIKGHGRKVAARVDDDETASKAGTTKAKSSKKMQRRKVDDGKAAANGGTSKAKPSKKSLQRRQ